MAEYLASIFGTEKDKVTVAFITHDRDHVICHSHFAGEGLTCLCNCLISGIFQVNCSFFFKTGACTHGERCSRIHNKPTFSQTILLQVITCCLLPAKWSTVPVPRGGRDQYFGKRGDSRREMGNETEFETRNGKRDGIPDEKRA